MAIFNSANLAFSDGVHVYEQDGWDIIETTRGVVQMYKKMENVPVTYIGLTGGMAVRMYRFDNPITQFPFKLSKIMYGNARPSNYGADFSSAASIELSEDGLSPVINRFWWVDTALQSVDLYIEVVGVRASEL